MLHIGSLVDGKYKILNKVGQGGMSVVYLAMNEKANKQWAVKEVRKDGVLDFEAVKQGLVAETDILKRLDHPYLPSIIDVIDTDESFIIIMDYIQGNSLNKALDEFGAQPQDEVIKWAKQLCDVLGYLLKSNAQITTDGGTWGNDRIYYYLHNSKEWLHMGVYANPYEMEMTKVKSIRIGNRRQRLRDFVDLMPLKANSKEMKSDQGLPVLLR